MKKGMFKQVNTKAFWICLCASLALITVSFIMPPTGIIDPSVLTAVGEIFAFAALATIIRGIEKGSDIKLSKGDVSVEIDNPDNQ